MTDELRQIAHTEGWIAYNDGVLCMDNPYEGVSDDLYYSWDDGWWDSFYKDEAQ